MLEAEKIIVVLSGAALIVISSYFAGVHHERQANKAKINKSIVNEIPKVAAKEAATNKAIEKVGNETESKVEDLANRNRILVNELGRLRVRTCPANAAATATASTRNAASNATKPAYGPGTGEVNLDGVAGKIIELGSDLDAANIRVDELRGLVIVYSKACKVD
jgi:hypothetical protein